MDRTPRSINIRTSLPQPWRSMPFLRAGNTHRKGEYKRNVASALAFITSQLTAENNVTDPRSGRKYRGTSDVFSHSIGTIALCEGIRPRTKDPKLVKACQWAVNLSLMTQDQQTGGWAIVPRSIASLQVTGWHTMALTTAKEAKVKVPIPPATFTRVSAFLDSVQADNGSAYNDQESGGTTLTTSALGLLCRCYTGWDKDNAALKRGVEKVAAFRPYEDSIYFSYYATLLMHRYGGEQWQKWRLATQNRIVPLPEQRRSDRWQLVCHQPGLLGPLAWPPRHHRVHPVDA